MKVLKAISGSSLICISNEKLFFVRNMFSRGKICSGFLSASKSWNGTVFVSSTTVLISLLERNHYRVGFKSLFPAKLRHTRNTLQYKLQWDKRELGVENKKNFPDNPTKEQKKEFSTWLTHNILTFPIEKSYVRKNVTWIFFYCITTAIITLKSNQNLEVWKNL